MSCQWMKCCVLCMMAVTARHFFPANLQVLSQNIVRAVAIGCLLEHPNIPETPGPQTGENKWTVLVDR